MVFNTVYGTNGLVQSTGEKRLATLAEPDDHGFRGFTCPGEITAYGASPTNGKSEAFSIDLFFPEDGVPMRQRSW